MVIRQNPEGANSSGLSNAMGDAYDYQGGVG